MPSRFWIAGFAVAAALVVGATTANAGASVTGTRGLLQPTAQNGRERGKYRLTKITRARKSVSVERVEATARRLNVSGASASNPPSFHVWLIKSDTTGAADFGGMRVTRHGQAAFVFDSRHAALPSGVTTISDYSGGTIEIRDGSNTAVLSATLGAF